MVSNTTKLVGGAMALIAPPLAVLAHSVPGMAGHILAFVAASAGSVGGWLSRGAGPVGPSSTPKA